MRGVLRQSKRPTDKGWPGPPMLIDGHGWVPEIGNQNGGVLLSSHTEMTPYRPDIDGLRAVSILLVVLYHAQPELVPGGFIGVDVFFVISGFLITRIIMTEIKAGNFSPTRFYARRVRRIFPALITV